MLDRVDQVPGDGDQIDLLSPATFQDALEPDQVGRAAQVQVGQLQDGQTVPLCGQARQQEGSLDKVELEDLVARQVRQQSIGAGAGGTIAQLDGEIDRLGVVGLQGQTAL